MAELVPLYPIEDGSPRGWLGESVI
jgi:hypothetical protein